MKKNKNIIMRRGDVGEGYYNYIQLRRVPNSEHENGKRRNKVKRMNVTKSERKITRK